MTREVVNPELRTVCTQLAALERRHRTLERAALIGIFLALSFGGGALYVAMVPRPMAEVEARRFTLRDSEGRTRAALTVREDGGASLYVADQSGAPRATIGVSMNGVPALGMSDRDGKLRAAVAVSAHGIASVGVFDRNEKMRAKLATDESGAPTLQLLDDQVRIRALLSTDQERTLLRIADPSGQTRVGLGLSSDSPGIVVFDEIGTMIGKMP